MLVLFIDRIRPMCTSVT